MPFVLSKGTLCSIGLAQFSRIIREMITIDIKIKQKKSIQRSAKSDHSALCYNSWSIVSVMNLWVARVYS